MSPILTMRVVAREVRRYGARLTSEERLDACAYTIEAPAGSRWVAEHRRVLCFTIATNDRLPQRQDVYQDVIERMHLGLESCPNGAAR
jgi:hypothetical protein